MTSPTPSEPRTGHQLYHAEALAPGRAWAVVGLSVATIYVLQIGAAALGALDLVAAVLGFAPVIAALGLAIRPRWHAIGLRWPRPRFLLAGALVGSAAWYANLVLVQLVIPHPDTSRLEHIVEQTPLVPTLLAIAVMPAIAEELVFRGVLARALAHRGRVALACLISAAVFGAYHVTPYQALPTFTLGLALAYVSLRADSVVPAMLAHLLNNAIAIAIARDEVPGITGWMDAHPSATLAGSLVAVACGLALARGLPRPRSRTARFARRPPP